MQSAQTNYWNGWNGLMNEFFKKKHSFLPLALVPSNLQWTRGRSDSSAASPRLAVPLAPRSAAAVAPQLPKEHLLVAGSPPWRRRRGCAANGRCGRAGLSWTSPPPSTDPQRRPTPRPLRMGSGRQSGKCPPPPHSVRAWPWKRCRFAREPPRPCLRATWPCSGERSIRSASWSPGSADTAPQSNSDRNDKKMSLSFRPHESISLHNSRVKSSED